MPRLDSYCLSSGNLIKRLTGAAALSTIAQKAGPLAEPLRAVTANCSRRDSVLLWLALLGVAGALLFFNLRAYSTLRISEAYVGVPAREMLRSGDWLVPHFAGEPRLEKPPLVYWLVAALGKFGGGIDELTVRAPSALAALLLVLLVGRWGTRWYGNRAGLAAALIQATSIYTIHWGRLGVVDVILTLLTTTALYVAALATEQRSANSFSTTAIPVQHPWARWLCFYFLLGAAGGIKPVIGPLLAFYTTVSFLLIERRYAELREMANPAGIFLCLALTVAWPWLVSQRNPGIWSLWFTETVGRGLGSRRYNDPFWFYAREILWMTLPWTPLLLFALPQSWRRAWREADARERFLWTWWLGQVVLLSLSAGKKSYYILPALPALSLIAGQKLAAVSTALEVTDRQRRRVAWTTVGTVPLVLSLAIAARHLTKQWPNLSHLWSITALVLALGGVTAIISFIAGRRKLALSAAGFAVMLTTLAVYGWIYPHFDNRAGALELSRAVERLVPQEKEVFLVAPNRSPLAFYIRPPVRLAQGEDAIQSHLSLKKELFVISEAAAVIQLSKFSAIEVLQNIRLAPHDITGKRPEISLLKVTAAVSASP